MPGDGGGSVCSQGRKLYQRYCRMSVKGVVDGGLGSTSLQVYKWGVQVDGGELGGGHHQGGAGEEHLHWYLQLQGHFA